MTTSPRWTPARRLLRVLTEALLLVAAYVAYEAVRHFASPDPTDALDRATNLIRVEQRLHLFFEPDLQRLVVDHGWLVTLFNWVYVWGYLPSIAAAAFYLYTWHRPFYGRYRNAFLVSGVIGLAIFAMLPVAPPRMFPELGFVDTVRLNSDFYRSVQGSDFVNEFAAVPSFHFGWTLLVGLALIQASRHRLLRVLGAALPVLMLAAILLTANHYLIDALAGAAVVLLALGVVVFLERRAPAIERPRLLNRAPHPDG